MFPAARKITLPKFELTKLASEETFPEHKYSGKGLYATDPILRPLNYLEVSPLASHSYNLMAVIVRGNGEPWEEANCYLINKLENDFHFNRDTLQCIASDLADFLRFLEEVNIDFLEFPANKLLRPTYRYRATLIHKIYAKEVAISTARRRMSSVVGFYNWLITEELFIPTNAPWKTKDIFIPVTSTFGDAGLKKTHYYDLSISNPKQNDPYSDYIADGEKLRPLTYKEQLWIVDALDAIQNTEMTLIHFLALFTGARIQTILTIGLHHVSPPRNFEDVLLTVGPGSGIDTKRSKKMTLLIPGWLYEKLHIYALSPRAKSRRSRYLQRNTDPPPLFLSERGAPLYTSRSSSQAFNPQFKIRHAKHGQAVRQFIKERVIPHIQNKSSSHFNFRFHDLRATFGMNLTDAQLELVKEGKITLHQAREYVRQRLWHSQLATTDLYLNYRKTSSVIRDAQEGYESYIQTLINKTNFS